MICRGTRWRAVLLAGAMSTVAALPAAQQETKTSGTVVDPAGSPVGGCTVWLIEAGYSRRTDATVVGQTVTDAQGRFAFPPQKAADPQRRAGHYVVARDAKGRIGWPQRSPRGSVEPSAAGSDKSQELQVRLVDVQDYRGRVLDDSGRPIAKATIRLMYVSSIEYPKPITELAFFPAEVGKGMGGETAADGSFVLHGVPARGTVSAEITAAGFGSPGASWGLSKPVTIRLQPAPGSIVGSFVCPADPAAVP